ncbi:unnamed protein product [Bursaphelenchus xylophilus]|nr:unnamed protein product [Bursaphelenchus xylophilus]CAG9113012.1 unnamed protein product [Bursaphelenchus xylophilus]
MSPLLLIVFLGVVSTVYGQSSRIPFVRFASTTPNNVVERKVEIENGTEAQSLAPDLGMEVNLNDFGGNYTTDMPLEMLLLRAEMENRNAGPMYWPFESFCLFDSQCNTHCGSHQTVCEGSLNSTCLESTCYRGTCFYCCEKEHGECKYPIPGIERHHQRRG